MDCYLLSAKPLSELILLSIWPQGTYFNEISFKGKNISFKKMHLEVLSAKDGHFVSASMC